jgi:hypothetical protein
VERPPSKWQREAQPTNQDGAKPGRIAQAEPYTGWDIVRKGIDRMLKAPRLAQAVVAVCICASMLRGRNDIAASSAPRKAEASTNASLNELRRISDLARRLEDASSSKRKSILREEPSALQGVLHRYLQDGKWDSPRLLESVKQRVGEDSFDRFIRQFGLDRDNQRGQIWELRSQLARSDRPSCRQLRIPGNSRSRCATAHDRN